MDSFTDISVPDDEPQEPRRIRTQRAPSADERSATTVVAWLDDPPARVVPGLDPPLEAFVYVRDVLVAGQRATAYRIA